MYGIDVGAIEKRFKLHYGKELAIDIDEKEQYNSLVDALISCGHLDGKCPVPFSVMMSNENIRSHGGKITISLYTNTDDNKIRWYGFCWRGYYNRYSQYVVVPFEEFVICEDFEFDPGETLSILFGL